MQGHRIGYVRVSSFDQNPERQLEQVQVDKVFTDKASGKDTQRPQLDALLGFVREGDTVVVHSMDRLARNLDDLRRLVQSLAQRGVRIEFVKEHLTFTGEDSQRFEQRGLADAIATQQHRDLARLGLQAHIAQDVREHHSERLLTHSITHRLSAERGAGMFKRSRAHTSFLRLCSRIDSLGFAPKVVLNVSFAQGRTTDRLCRCCGSADARS